ncbi:MAG: hypothetical protein A2X35_01910 [Elusimicrobia bacterium GWA2_61_42]|nr:MAG: hypothetical protein A2X35_01910 [Elusimicrobia bacterium GWA2_61_42]OGR78690.1 MAG: hypothetical protein A2X38_03850 [Elusimicrobia bacterium GWC2_61_25]
MKKTLLTLLLLGCCSAVQAQAPDQPVAEKPAAAVKKSAPEAKPAAAPAETPAQAKAKKAARAEAQKKAEARQEEQDAEESVVMIDSKPDAEDTGRFSAGAADQEEAAVPGGLPSSYGQCKGIITEAGRTVLVFESLDDGALSFVQVILGKTGVSWKLLDRIPRSMD